MRISLIAAQGKQRIRTIDKYNGNDGVVTTTNGKIDISLLPSLDVEIGNDGGSLQIEEYLKELEREIINLENELDSKANTIHTHDDRYYKQSEIDSLVIDCGNFNVN